MKMEEEGGDRREEMERQGRQEGWKMEGPRVSSVTPLGENYAATAGRAGKRPSYGYAVTSPGTRRGPHHDDLIHGFEFLYSKLLSAKSKGI